MAISKKRLKSPSLEESLDCPGKPATQSCSSSSASPLVPSRQKRIKAKPQASLVPIEHVDMSDFHISILKAKCVDISKPWSVHSGPKAKKGLDLNILKRIDAIGVYAVKTMKKPVGFQLIWTHASNDLDDLMRKLRYLPKVLDRYGVREKVEESISEEILFFYKVESTGKGNVHVHLHCIADGFGTHEIRVLTRRLSMLMGNKVRHHYRMPVLLSFKVIKIHNDSGKEISNKQAYHRYPFHFLKAHFSDWRERASYCAKNETKKSIGTFSSFHCSRVSLGDDRENEVN